MPAQKPALALLLGLPFAACAPGSDVGPPISISPTHAAMFGQVPVTVTFDPSIGTPTSLRVGGVPAYGLAVSETTVTATLQGAPAPGPADVELIGTAGRSLHPLFTYDPPVAGVPLAWAAFGASLTMGMQSSGIDVHSQLAGFAAQVARAAGAYLGLPLFQGTVLPPLVAADFNPDCSQKPGTGASAATLNAGIVDPATHVVDLRRSRVDWTLPPRDLAIGGSTTEMILHGGRGLPAILEHCVEEPDVDPSDAFAGEDVSQIDRLEKLDPDLALSGDLLANDVLQAVLGADDLHPDRIDPTALKANVQAIAARLGRLHGHYFIANLPSVTFLPNVAALRAMRLAAGSDTAQSFDAKVQRVDAITDDLNAALADALHPFPNLHLVDIHGAVEQLRVGVTVGSERLGVGHLGGLLSFDDLHFSDTGYALFANVFVAAIDQALGAHIPMVDIAAVHATDPLAPAALRAAGLQCVR